MAALSQLITTAYAEVLADKRKPHNQWRESAFLRLLEKIGAVKRRPGGSAIEYPLDKVKNPSTDVLATDFTATAVTQTSIFAGASYDMANIATPINWSIADEARWSGDENRKIDAVKGLISNALDSNDDEIELDLFSTSTDGFLGLQNLVPTSGQPNIGGIDGSSITYWRNYASTYALDGSNLNAALILAFNTASKGTGAELSPEMVVSGSTAQSLYEGNLVDLKRFMGEETGDAGFKYLAFKTAKWVFSQYGGTLTTNPIYMLNSTSFNLVVTKGYFRRLEDAVRQHGFAARNQMVFSQCQATVNNPSRCAVLTGV
jgi:hypothetical protein